MTHSLILARDERLAIFCKKKNKTKKKQATMMDNYAEQRYSSVVTKKETLVAKATHTGAISSPASQSAQYCRTRGDLARAEPHLREL